MADFAEQYVRDLLRKAGIEVGGHRPFDLSVHDQRFYLRVLKEGVLGVGESYMDEWWDCDAIDQLVDRISRSNILSRLDTPLNGLLQQFFPTIFNYQSRKRAFMVGEKHYDIGNELYTAMLDKRMTYSCAYWKNATTLDNAQEAKLDLICKKLDLKKGQRVLEVGCGWGSFAKFAAEKYGVSVVGLTVSKEQAAFAKESCKGLSVDILLEDYRDVKGMFDHIVSIGMFEHVGYKNYRAYMKVVEGLLKEGGMFLLHTIGGNVSTKHVNPWTDKYIFPNGMLPSIKQIGESIEGLFVMEDWHNFGPYYDRTLMEWHKNFIANWEKLSGKYDKRFYRMWSYYLLTCAGDFRARDEQLWQIVLSKGRTPGVYKTIR